MEKLNVYLADLMVDYIKLHDLHWNVKGKTFVQVHLYTESRYNDVSEKFDDVAEKIIMQGGKPVSNMKKALEIANIKELDKESYTDKEVLEEVLKDTIYLKDVATKLREEYDAAGNFSIVSLLEDHVTYYEKEIWFLTAMQK